MSRKRYTPEQIISMLREAEVALAQGQSSGQACRTLGVLEVNYVYKLGDIEENHEAYSDEGKVVAASSVRGLARRERASRGASRGAG